MGIDWCMIYFKVLNILQNISLSCLNDPVELNICVDITEPLLIELIWCE